MLEKQTLPSKQPVGTHVFAGTNISQQLLQTKITSPSTPGTSPELIPRAFENFLRLFTSVFLLSVTKYCIGRRYISTYYSRNKSWRPWIGSMTILYNFRFKNVSGWHWIETTRLSDSSREGRTRLERQRTRVASITELPTTTWQKEYILYCTVLCQVQGRRRQRRTC